MTGMNSQDLGEGLVLRRATREDAERLVAFQGDVHREPEDKEPDEGVAAWVQDLVSGKHPTFDVSDFTMVEDTNTGAIVSSLCLISQTWAYAGIPFAVGRPELVGTHPDYRRRGLVRAQFQVIHDWSAERGEMMQAITGIPWYYRQFGYEMALALGGGRIGYKTQVPQLKDEQKEPYQIRIADAEDTPFIAQVVDHGSKRSLISCQRDEAMWQYEISGASPKNVNRRVLCIIETPDGEPVGFISRSATLWRNRLTVGAYELKPGISWLATTPTVVRYLWAKGEELEAENSKQKMEAFAFWLGEEHPVYEVLQKRLPHTVKPYAWYLRVPNLRGFLLHIAPALEQRLAESNLVGHSGELKISFYRDGLTLVFERGKLVRIEPWKPGPEAWGDAAFPDLTFLKLLFGYRSLKELEPAFPDCWTEHDEAQSLIKILFPKSPSDFRYIS